MGYKIIVRQLASNQITEAARWYEVRRKGLGGVFLLSVKDTLKLLAKSPFLYVRVYSEIRRALVKRFPYTLYYEIDDEKREVTVFSAVNTDRDSDVWKGDMGE